MRLWRTLHNWIGLLVALQVLAWISGGVIMSVIPIDMVRGKHLLAPVQSLTSSPAVSPDYQPDLVRWEKVEWVSRLDKAVIKLSAFDKTQVYLDPMTGASLASLDAAQAGQVAQQHYLGAGRVAAVELLARIPQEAGNLRPPMYAVDFDDWIHTRFYVGPDSAQVERVRSDLWRVYDFFWMLHIMDYDERENFNNPLVIAASLVALVFTMTGFILLYFSFIKPQTRIIRRAVGQRRSK